MRMLLRPCQLSLRGSRHYAGSCLRAAASNRIQQRRHYSGVAPSPPPPPRSKHEDSSLSALGDDGSKVVVFSGIQPTGIPHLGNYLGAMRQWKQIQDQAPPGSKLLFSIVDLHAITMPQDPKTLMQNKREMMAAMLAIGLDPKRSVLFYQSSVPAHAELMWILSCTASMGYLGRMTQWKTKIQGSSSSPSSLPEDASFLQAPALKLGLFSYPVLQAADILLYNTTHVPVGDDQRQHLEFARECVTNFNSTYGSLGQGKKSVPLLTYPRTITTKAPRVMSLLSPTEKMSKSSPHAKSRILITDEPSKMRKLIMGARTDSLGNEVTSYDPENRPGVANLLDLWAQCSGGGTGTTKTGEDMIAELRRGGRGAEDEEGQPPPPSPPSLGDLKKAVADAVTAELEGVGERFGEIMGRKGGRYVDEVQEEGAEEARKMAEGTMRMVREVVGLGAR